MAVEEREEAGLLSVRCGDEVSEHPRVQVGRLRPRVVDDGAVLLLVGDEAQQRAAGIGDQDLHPSSEQVLDEGAGLGEVRVVTDDAGVGGNAPGLEPVIEDEGDVLRLEGSDLVIHYVSVSR